MAFLRAIDAGEANTLRVGVVCGASMVPPSRTENDGAGERTATADPAHDSMKRAAKRPRISRSERCMVEPRDGAERLPAVVGLVHTSDMPRRASKNAIIKNPALIARASKGGKA